MKALILSAGRGERLLPLTTTIPKPLLQVGGLPLIHYGLLMLKAAGITQIAINVHHLAAQIEAALSDGQLFGLSITYSPEPALMGTGGPLLALRDYFAGEPFVIVNGDTLIDLDLPRLIAFHRARGGLTTLVLRAAGDPDAYSRIEVDPTGQIRRMRLLRGRGLRGFDDYPAVLAPADAALLAPYMYCGVMVCDPALLELMPPAPPFSLIADLLAPLVTRGLFGFVHAGFFRTVDDLSGYAALRDEFANTPPPLSYLGRTGQLAS